MSADNWAKCPRCLKQAADKKKAAEEAMQLGYGKVPQEEFLVLKAEADAPIALEDTLREDYEVGIWQYDFRLHYDASCEVCGFKFSYRYEEEPPS